MNVFPEFKPDPLFKEYVRYETRRQFFKRGASLMGMAALASLAPNLLFAEDKKSAHLKKIANAAAGVRAKGEADYLSAHGRRAVAVGFVRLQAGHGRLV